jgi:hypothetical protein
MGFWREHRELRRLEAELRAARHEAPREFIRKLVARLGEPTWLTPRPRIGLAVAVGALGLAAIASAGGVGVIDDGMKAAWHVIDQTTHTSPPRLVTASAANTQYRCGTPDQPCHITIYDSSAKEPKTGSTGTMSFTVSLDATPSTAVTVDYTMGGGNAVPGACFATPTTDYTPPGTASPPGGPGVVVFPAGTASETITVPICGDKSVGTSQETYKVTLGPVTSGSALIYRSQATGTILT